MKKIINKKLYDTEKAELVYNYESGHNYSDFNYFEESLYLSKNGQFFLAGKGGPASKYANRAGNMSYNGENLRILSSSEAYEWLESVNAHEAILKYFKDEIEEG